MERHTRFAVKRGEIWTAGERGRMTGKPRPVLIVQNNVANERHATVTACLISSVIGPAVFYRIALQADEHTGLDAASEIQADRLYSYLRESFRERVGVIDDAMLRQVERAIERWLVL